MDSLCWDFEDLLVPCHPCLSVTQVAEIHRASKDGQLYDVEGNTRSHSAQAQPPEPTEYDIRPASQVYSVSSILGYTPNLGLGKASPPLVLSHGMATGPLWVP